MFQLSPRKDAHFGENVSTLQRNRLKSELRQEGLATEQILARVTQNSARTHYSRLRIFITIKAWVISPRVNPPRSIPRTKHIPLLLKPFLMIPPEHFSRPEFTRAMCGVATVRHFFNDTSYGHCVLMIVV